MGVPAGQLGLSPSTCWASRVANARTAARRASGQGTSNARPGARGRGALDQTAAAQRVWTRQLGERLGSERLAQLNALLDDVVSITEAA